MSLSAVISELASHLGHLTAREVAPLVLETLAGIGAHLEADRCYLLLGAEADSWRLAYDWRADGQDGDVAPPDVPVALRLDDHPYETCRKGLCLLGRAKIHTALGPRAGLPLIGGAQALCLVPLCVQGNLRGFLGAESLSSSIEWGGRELEGLRVVASLLSGALRASLDYDALTEAYGGLLARTEVQAHDHQRRQAASDGLREVLVALNSDRPLHEILAQIAQRASEVLDSASAVLYRYDGGQGVVTVEAQFHAPDDLAGVVTLPYGPRIHGSELVGSLAVPDDPLAVADLEGLVRELAPQPARVDGRIEPWIASITRCYRALLSVPLLVKDEVYGGLSLYYGAARGFSDAEIALATLFGDQAALAIENSRLRAQVEKLAVLQERSRLARDLHDSVTQSLYSLTLMAEAARRLASTGDAERVGQAIGRLGEIGQQALKEMRLLVYQLRPSALRTVGLIGALQHRLDTVEKRAGVEAQMTVVGIPELPVVLEEELYFIVQEALNNSLKHAAATAVSLTLEALDGAVRFVVQDNGRGFDLRAPERSWGLGLETMRERTEQLAGTLAVTSQTGAGTRVEVTVPSAGAATLAWGRSQGDPSPGS